jgi:UDP-N-acetylglucosamine 2-epimerase (non-hydrolysing)
MPEEINRVVTDVLADLHFTTSPEARDNLLREGVADDGIHFVGNPMIDTLLAHRDRFDAARLRDRLALPERYGVATLHRPANVDDPGVAARIVRAVVEVASILPLVIPLHPRGRPALEAAGLAGAPGVTIIDPLGYVDFLSLIAEARAVLTDSGGIQEETTYLGIPCFTLRDNTERPVTLTSGTNTLLGLDPGAIARIPGLLAERVGVPSEPPPLWDGQAAQRIADVILS